MEAVKTLLLQIPYKIELYLNISTSNKKLCTIHMLFIILWLKISSPICPILSLKTNFELYVLLVCGSII